MGKGFYWKLAVTNIKSNRRVYFPYILSSIGIIMMFYIILSLSLGIDEEAMYGGSTVTTMMALGTIVIAVFALIFLFYTNSFIMKRRKKELGLYNILGMEKRHIGRIILRETALVSAISIGLGMGLGILFSKLMFLALGKVLGLALPINFVIPFMAVAATIVFFLIIFFATMLYNMLQVRLAKPIELLHGGETGEKEPKAHWILAILGAAFLGAGYYISLSIISPIDAIFFFFLAVIFVIIGTYLLFITGITALLKLLKKNKGFYYKTRHFTTISGMLYRMKQNAAGLASICILFTCLLVTVSTTFSLYSSMDDLIRTRYPRNVMIRSEDANEKALDMINTIISEECEEMGISPLNLVESTGWACTVARTDNRMELQRIPDASFGMMEIYTLNSYNKFSGQSISLNENEILFSDPQGTFHYDTMMIGDREYKLIPTDYDFSEGETSVLLYETYYVVIPDEGFINILESTGGEDGYEVQGPIWSYSFDIEGGKDNIAALSSSISDRFINDFPTEGVEFAMLRIEDSASSYDSFFSLYGGLFFLGMYLGLLFLMGTALIIYYKQVSEGYEDSRRFQIMQKVGMSHKEVKRSIHSQIMLVFFLPLLTAVLHLAFAFPMLQKILAMLNLTNLQLILISTLGCVVVFAIAYALIYAITAKTYYKIVEAGID